MLSKLRFYGYLLFTTLALCIALLTASSTPLAAAANQVQADIATPAATGVPFDFDAVKGQISTQIQSYMNDNQIVTCSFAAAYTDSVGALKTQTLSFGTLSRDSKTPASPATMYEIGSLSKLFAANLLVKFVQDGLMQLDDPLQKYLPSTVHVPTFNGQEITLRELATHTSALPRSDTGGITVSMVNGKMVAGYTPAATIYEFLNNYKLTYAPGTKWLYSNLAFGLLGMAEEKVGGDTLEHLVLKWIAEPLGLHDTRAEVLPAEMPFLAIGYNAKNTKAAPFSTQGETISAGGLRSSIQDLATYLVANIDPASTKIETILTQTHERQTAGPTPNIDQTLGWSIASPNTSDAVFTKAGSTVGFTSYIAFSAVTRKGFVIACDGPNVTKILGGPLSKIMGLTPTSLDDNE